MSIHLPEIIDLKTYFLCLSKYGQQYHKLWQNNFHTFSTNGVVKTLYILCEVWTIFLVNSTNLRPYICHWKPIQKLILHTCQSTNNIIKNFDKLMYIHFQEIVLLKHFPYVAKFGHMFSNAWLIRLYQITNQKCIVHTCQSTENIITNFNKKVHTLLTNQVVKTLSILCKVLTIFLAPLN